MWPILCSAHLLTIYLYIVLIFNEFKQNPVTGRAILFAIGN